MASIEDCLEKIEELNQELKSVLLKGEADKVEGLVAAQCQYMVELQNFSVTTVYKPRLQRIHEEILQQQVLIRQALEVTQFFLQRVHGQTSFSKLA